MEYRTMGSTGLRVSEIGVGTSLSFRAMADSDEDLCISIIHEALAQDINFIDTAPVYGESERVLGKALEGKRSEVILASKVWQTDAASARSSVERSLELLRTDFIDLLQIHNMAGWREITPTLQKLKEEGLVRHLGITDRNPKNYGVVMEAMRTGAYETIQIPYFLGETSCRAEVLPLARKMNMGVIVMRPFSQLISRESLLKGAAASSGTGLAGGSQLLGAGADETFSFLKDYGCETTGQGLLKHLLADPTVSSIIPATAKTKRIAENAAASDGIPLPPEVCERLESLMI